ncbi:MAG: MoxR family ATPase [Gammaproteobacteria bacterium]|nr:MoxR family ATPase [Gammaproteobacteria bacterium]
MNNAFHIIHKPKCWNEHDTHHLPDKLKSLNKTALIEQQRDLETSAEKYQPSDTLLTAINAALAARAPLLLTGEPGTGKTQVAWFIKRFFNIPLYAYQVHSNSQASELHYDFDAVAYLRDAYLPEDKQPEALKNATDDPRSHPRYLKKGPLWQAYDCDNECVFLIDEIDKAPRDFPNDLLQELDQNRFAHPFASESVQRKGSAPITIITSNGERRLPDAFLRRCLVHHIEMTTDLLRDIMQAWQDSQFPDLDAETQSLALQHFEAIRNIPRLSKQPGAAELLVWLSVLSAQNIKAKQLDESVPLSELPALVCLIKDHSDYAHLQQS